MTGIEDAPVACLKGVVKRYGSVTALSGVDLEIRRGEVLALLGPNGAGKSTAISLWLGLSSPDAGAVQLFGEAPRELSARRRIGIMLQAAQLPDSLRVGELLRLTRAYYPKPRGLEETARLAGIGALLKRPYAKLSGGQQRSVQFALALIGNPELIFLDEPTTGLDLESRERLWGAIRAEVSRGCAILLTTHYLEEAEVLAHRVAVIAQGRLVAEGSVDTIRDRVTQKRLRARSRVAAERAAGWTGVTETCRDGEWLSLRANHVEDVLRRWLSEDPSLADLEVTRPRLADAFVELIRTTPPQPPADGVLQ